ncbi:plasma-membrane proton-efflux P-type ATPase [Patescibacteria group bacterium]|nr:plasma-membrane proton-efflux P-type ATPase [Patescibacteria group bacterium]MDE1946288.1 plasma-membrane proton-efflux P-type ATPase [Patescibacteria group bacterium]MDE2010740.1 plasma-membrane proton-efflux P-type ATPase [Patescibacteria group bacterium]
MHPTQGLTNAEAEKLRAKFGPNTISERKKSAWRRLIKKVVSPMSMMFVAAGVLSAIAGEGADAAVIAALFITNISVSVWHESKADNAIELLKKNLTVIVKTMRDGAWVKLPSIDLVPDDIVELTVGDLVPADIECLECKNVSVNEAAVTGESMPKEKNFGDKGYSGSFVVTGLIRARVTATGGKTYFGTAVSLVEGDRRASSLEKDVLSVSKFLSVISIFLVGVLTIALLAAHQPILKIATLDVSMLIAGIPVALPTVMTLVISVGVVKLARRAIIVRRLSSLEDLANVNLLLSDKTGTLTENRITVDKMVPLCPDFSDRQIWSLAIAASPDPEKNPLAVAILNKGGELRFSACPIVDFVPGDSERKRATIFFDDGGNRKAASLGAPQVIMGLSDADVERREAFVKIVETAAKDGFRVLALAVSNTDKEEAMKLAAVFYLADEIRKDARQTISFLNDYGIAVKMVTGDGYDVAVHVAHDLGIEGKIVRKSDVENAPDNIKNEFAQTAGFAEVLPKDKYDIVTLARSANAGDSSKPYVVAVTGDGVNDVPPVKTADVGIAVANAVDALKGAADIVLTSAGIAVIRDAIIEARKIFVRLYNYSVYRISESFRLIITIAVIGVIFGTYPLTPVQIILIALLDDVPIISLAYDRVVVSRAPAAINARKRFTMSTLYGLTGVANSMFLLWISYSFLHLPWAVIQTMFFLKLTVSGHMLIYVAHTDQPWYKFLPSKQVIWATSVTQIIATILSVAGIFVSAIPLSYALLVWVWAFGWMQAGELVKRMFAKHG